ncbi:response regulator [Methanobacterium sp.]|uniref:response regulator n=1 Tax=Methanobacterium sp. TaxID=2164 RepID=UPI003C72F68B
MEKILIVEDEGITSFELKTKIESWGYSVVGIASRSEDVLKMIQYLEPDLITMDITIRGEMDGIELVEILQKTREIPIIYVSAHSSDMIMERALKTSPYAFLIKPFADKELKFAIELALKKHNMKKELDNDQIIHKIISENSGDVIWILDIASNKFTYVSYSIENLRGYTPEEVLEQSLEEVMTPESYQKIIKNLPLYIRAIMTGDESARVTTHEVDQIHKDGSIIPTEVVTTLLTDDNGTIDRVLGVTRSMASKKKF